MSLNPFSTLKKSVKNETYLPSTSYSPVMVMNGQTVFSQSYVSAFRALKNSDIYTAVNRISSDVSNCRFITYNSAVRDLLNNPNSILNSYSFWQSVIGQLLLEGNSYVFIHLNDRNIPNSLELLAPSQVQVIVSNDGQTVNYSIHFNDDRDDIQVDSKRMLHFKLLTNVSETPFLGVSPLNALIPDLNIQDSANMTAINTLKKAIRPNGIITLAAGTVDPEGKEKVRKAFEDANSGENVGRVMVLDQSATYSVPEIDKNIASLLNSVTYTRNQVAKVFGIPQDFLNNESEHSNIEQIRADYSQSLSKYINSIASELTMKFGVDIKLDMSSAIDPDNKDYANQIAKLANSYALDGNQTTYILKKIGYISKDTPDYVGRNRDGSLKGGD